MKDITPKKYSGKVAIIGAGHVGAAICYAMSLHGMASDIVLINRTPQRATGEVMDIRHGVAMFDTTDVRTGGFEECADCDLIVITAGRACLPGERRYDLTEENTQAMKVIVDEIKKYYTRGAVLVISNPVDVMTALISQWLKLPTGRVFGLGCMLDESRLIRMVADHVGVGIDAVHGFVVGEHGENQTPLWSGFTVNGVAIGEYCEKNGTPWDEEVRGRLDHKMKMMGGKIVRFKGHSQYGIATCVCAIADAVLNQVPMIASVSTLMDEEGVALSVPSIIGPGGVQQRLMEGWSAEEYKVFAGAADFLREVIISGEP